MLDRTRTGMASLWDGQVFGRGVGVYIEREKLARDDTVRYAAEIPIEHSPGTGRGCGYRNPI